MTLFGPSTTPDPSKEVYYHLRLAERNNDVGVKLQAMEAVYNLFDKLGARTQRKTLKAVDRISKTEDVPRILAQCLSIESRGSFYFPDLLKNFNKKLVSYPGSSKESGMIQFLKWGMSLKIETIKTIQNIAKTASLPLFSACLCSIDSFAQGLEESDPLKSSLYQEKNLLNRAWKEIYRVLDTESEQEYVHLENLVDYINAGNTEDWRNPILDRAQTLAWDTQFIELNQSELYKLALIIREAPSPCAHVLEAFRSGKQVVILGTNAEEHLQILPALTKLIQDLSEFELDITVCVEQANFNRESFSEWVEDTYDEDKFPYLLDGTPCEREETGIDEHKLTHEFYRAILESYKTIFINSESSSEGELRDQERYDGLLNCVHKNPTKRVLVIASEDSALRKEEPHLLNYISEINDGRVENVRVMLLDSEADKVLANIEEARERSAVSGNFVIRTDDTPLANHKWSYYYSGTLAQSWDNVMCILKNEGDASDIFEDLTLPVVSVG